MLGIVLCGQCLTAAAGLLWRGVRARAPERPRRTAPAQRGYPLGGQPSPSGCFLMARCVAVIPLTTLEFTALPARATRLRPVLTQSELLRSLYKLVLLSKYQEMGRRR
jgi:hypothetical protein